MRFVHIIRIGALSFIGCLCVELYVAAAQSFTFSTLAGNAGYGTADGAGQNARFHSPQGVTVDSAGNVFVADTANSTIRRIDAAGVVTTFAGSPGKVGGSNGPALSARFARPQGLVADNAGNLYVADTDNSTIRKISPAGVVSTIVGSGTVGSADGTNTAATFNLPSAIAIDSFGNLYVADTYNSTIRMISPIGTNWITTTLAGSSANSGSTDGTNSSARFYQPMAIAVDSNRTVYIADSGNNKIRTASLSGTNWVTSTLLTVTYGGGLALQGTNLLVADSTGNCIRKIARSGTNWSATVFAGSPGNVGTTDGTAKARFNYPRGLATSANGTLYVADCFNNTIRQISQAGSVSTLAGKAGGPGSTDGLSSQARFNAPTGVAADAAGNLYVADSQNNTIREISSAGVVTTLAGVATNPPGSFNGVGTNASFFSPTAVAVDNGGNVFVADFYNNEIRKVSPAATNWQVTTFAGRAGVANAGWITNFIGPITNAVVGSNIVSTAFSATSLYTNYSGAATNISGTTTNLLIVITNTPVYTNVFHGQTNVIQLATNLFTLPPYQSAFVFNYKENYVNYSGLVTKITGTITNSIIVVTNVPIISVVNVINNKTVTNTVALVGNVFHLPAAPRVLDGYSTNSLFYHPTGLAFDQLGNLYVADGGTNGIRVITSGRSVSSLPASTGAYDVNPAVFGTSQLQYESSSVAIDNNGIIYVSDSANNTIRQIAPNGLVITIAGFAGYYGSVDGAGTNARFASPVSLALDSKTNLFVTDALTHTIRKVTPNGLTWTVSTIGGTSGLSGSTDGPGASALFNQPSGIATDAFGNLFIADTGNNVIRFGQPQVIMTTPVTLQAYKLANQIVVTWPTSAVGFTLEVRTDILSGNPWSPVLIPPTIAGENFSVTNDTIAPAAFYRLHAQ